MTHILASIRDVPVENLKAILKQDAHKHAEEGLFLEHIWADIEEPGRVLFLFRTENLPDAKRFIEKVHMAARKDDPNVNLPKMVYLDEK